jgi:hypothetical protein
VTFFITGNYRKFKGDLKSLITPNIIPTGFLSETDYVDLLFTVDGVIALTKSIYCMLCGCYEAVSAEKPLITSNQSVLKEYFSEAIFVDNTPSEISRAVRTLLLDFDTYKTNIKCLKKQLLISWENQFKELTNLLIQIQN